MNVAFKAFIHRTNLDSFLLRLTLPLLEHVLGPTTFDVASVEKKKKKGFTLFLSRLTSNRGILSLSSDFTETETCPCDMVSSVKRCDALPQARRDQRLKRLVILFNWTNAFEMRTAKSFA